MIPLDGAFLLSIAPVFTGRESLAQRKIVFSLADRMAPVLADYAIDTPLRIAHFMAQITHECAGFRTTQEFADGTAYEGRADLGNDQPGDGPRYKGRGLLQLTGRNNYRRYGGLLALPLEDQPELAADPVTSLQIACVYWSDHDINPLCDADDLLAVTRKVNGRLNGLEDRQACLARAKRAVAERWAIAVGAGQGVGPVLHLGSFGPEVERLQRALVAGGCPLPVDADFGPATLLAVRQAQGAAGLVADGIVGARTWAALGCDPIADVDASAQQEAETRTEPMNDHVTTHQAEEDARNEEILIWVNGALKKKAEATVSVYDSGFMLGDGVWEGLRLYDGHWAFLDDHMDRLFEAAKAIDLDIGLDRAGVIAALRETQAANGMTTDAHARLMVTRGVKARPFQHPALSKQGPTMVIIMEHSKPSLPRPINLATVPHLRGLPMTQDPKLNSHSKLNCILACIAAEKAGADEGLMLDVHGFVNTTNACNFFIVKKGEVWTSTGDYCMNGITRQKVIDICRAEGIPIFERNFSLVDTYSADEAFLTGTFGAQTPVGEIDGRVIGTGELGPMTKRLRGLYKDLVEADAKAAAQ